MKDCSNYCLYCCETKGRSAGCVICGEGAAGREVEYQPRDLPPGTLLDGRYLVGRELGAGGFGITYLAVDLNLDTRVAIKEYMPRDIAMRSTDGLSALAHSRGDETDFEFGLQQFLDEARRLARFEDVINIVNVKNYFEAYGTAYMVMQYLEGVTLGWLLEQRGRIPEEEVVHYAVAMMDGLRAVHASGMLHRDIKPDNVFVTNDGYVKLIDFGSARFSTGARSCKMSVIITEGFAPFEQYYSEGRQGPWTDVYSVGATIYALLVGDKPPSALARHDGVELKSPRELLGDRVSEVVSAAVMKAMSLQSAQRFQDVRFRQQYRQYCSAGDMRLPGMN